MSKRICFYVPIDQYVEGRGYVPSVVTEGEAGHAPLTGQGELSEPWYWGHAYATAQRIAEIENRKLGLSPDDVATIIASSIGESLRLGAVHDEVERKLGRKP